MQHSMDFQRAARKKLTLLQKRLVKFETQINFLEESLSKEKKLRKDLEKSKNELKTSTSILQYKVAKLKEEY